ncbi:AAA family ATPase [Streptomyces erythrochromogenes]|uniref:AAA family ATPase n=1 Tax=Streptomyces erythrochromogenes TaxID=285574 RepID=UPI0036AD23EC
MQRTGGEVPKEPALIAVDGDNAHGQRRLLTVAVRDYEDFDGEEAVEFAAGIDEQLEVVTQWWGPNGPAAGFHHVSAGRLQSRHDVEDLLRKEDVREMQGHALVVFITGHGIPGTSGTHFLKLPATAARRSLATAVRTSDIVMAALDSHVQNVLVIVNACYAAKLHTELSRLLREIGRVRQERCQLDVLVTCDQNNKVEVRRFATTLRQVFERLQRTREGITSKYLTVEEFRAEYVRALPPGDRKRHRLRRLVDGGYEPSPCLPNPGYLHNQGHWLQRATGRTYGSDEGWYFRGRHALNRKIAAFLGPHRPRGVLLVTGSTGSGKSAVVARAVVLSDPQFRVDPLYKTATDLADDDTIPPEGAVTAAVLADRRDAATVAADILRALDVTPQPLGPADDAVVCWTRQLRQFVQNSDHPVTLVIDGLDEALEPHRIMRDVMAPLDEFCRSLPLPRREGDPPTMGSAVRLLITTSSPRPPTTAATQAADGDGGFLQELKQLFPLADVERTDAEDAYQAIEEYLSALIGADQDQVTADAAAALAAPRLSPSFVHARLAGQQLRAAADPVELAGRPTWQAMLEQGIRGLLTWDLEWYERNERDLTREMALSLLRASAFAQGVGVPWSDVWPQIAGALLRRRLPAQEWDTAIDKLLAGRLSGYLARDHEDNRLVYRPAHAAITAILENADDNLPDPGE